MPSSPFPPSFLPFSSAVFASFAASAFSLFGAVQKLAANERSQILDRRLSLAVLRHF